MNKKILFTDLDGTLMDEETYSFQPALPALKRLKSLGIPVIPCTSKTSNEVIEIMNRIGLNGPFIVENGSAIFYPEGYFDLDHPKASILGYRQVVLGVQYQDILTFFFTLKEKFDLPALGFSKMPLLEIQRHTNFSEEEAQVAKNREFSEPFILTDQSFDITSMLEFVLENGFRLLKGNRFYHLLGKSDKGQAVQELRSMYSNKYPEDTIESIGIGDSMNDVEMLKEVDYPVFVRKSNGRHLDNIDIAGLLRTNGIGPSGWREAVDFLV
jgi:mannosyl-3-phosphoglycerate phosphatase